jgi:hypothetical protein
MNSQTSVLNLLHLSLLGLRWSTGLVLAQSVHGEVSLHWREVPIKT